MNTEQQFMRFLIRFIITLTGLAILLLVISFILPRTISVERNILIESELNNVFEQVNIPDNWKNWAPWLHNDSTLTYSSSKFNNGKIPIVKWKSRNKHVNEGELKIIKFIENQLVEFELTVVGKGIYTGTFIFSKKENASNIVWIIHKDLGNNPANRWLGLLTKKTISNEMDMGLFNIDDFLQQQKTSGGFIIEEIVTEPKIYVSIRDTATLSSIKTKYRFMLEQILKFIKSNNLTPSGSPMLIYHSFSDTLFDIETCLPVPKFIQTTGKIQCGQIESVDALLVKQFGQIQSTSGAYNALQAGLNSRGLSQKGPFWEEFITDQHNESDSTIWQTNIYLPVK